MRKIKAEPPRVVAGVTIGAVKKACQEIDCAAVGLDDEADECTNRKLELKLKRYSKALEHIWDLVRELSEDLEEGRY